MNSAIYRGKISHRRLLPKTNQFVYSMYMMYLDLDELDTVFDERWLWSARRPALAWFRRADHWGNPAEPLSQSIRDLIEAESGHRHEGPIRLLTHLRYFGYCFNPISVYYCFDDDGTLKFTVLEVSNTPWKEMQCYVLPAEPGDREHYQHSFDKALHVSPFMPMNMSYRCKWKEPGDRLNLTLENWRDEQRVFDAHLDLQRHEISARMLSRTLLSDPLITLRVVALIHWQALKLWARRIPLHAHPRKKTRGDADKLTAH